MTFTLGPRAAAAGHRVVAFDTVDSTNSEAMRLAGAGEGGPLWIAARAQCAGRGRRGRTWISPKGNLFASLLTSGRFPPATAATLGFVAALAAHAACRACAPALAGTLKWPNDILVEGRKVGGLLLESQALNGRLAVIVGFGINLFTAPAGTPFPATALARLGAPVAPEEMFAQLTDAWIDWERIWDEGRGFADIRAAWLERAQGLGEPISVRLDERIEAGIFETLDESGRLILRGAGGAQIAISAGDVHFGIAATAGAD